MTTLRDPDAPEVELDVELRHALRQVARTPHLLVTTDYDGTVAPIVSDPSQAFPLRESISALRALSALPATTVAVVSGRALRDLAVLSRLPSEIHLVGSHGSEFDLGFVHAIDDQAGALLRRVVEALHEVVDGVPGVSLEVKPASVAVHVRRADAGTGATIIDTVRKGPASWPGIHVTEGKAVIELAVIETNKGHAVDVLRHQAGASAAVFLGDDVTDERAFARLSGPDIGVKVGAGESAAGYRVDTPHDAARVLAMLAEERSSWLRGANATPIEALTLIADGANVALIGPDATVTWLCHPEPDSAAVFAHLLGGEGGGHFSISPVRPSRPLDHDYVGDTMTVTTRWSGVSVTDFLDAWDRAPGMRRHVTELVRILEGDARARIVFAPRPEFGGIPVHLAAEEEGLRVLGGAEPMVLRSPGVTWEIHADGQHETATATVDLARGNVILELRCGSDDLGPHEHHATERRRRGDNFWSEWVAGLTLPPGLTGSQRAMVVRSALTLKALCHMPSGGVLAAATTSLPEGIGGIRNWDYRYCWLRDAALTVTELAHLGSTFEGEGFLGWMEELLAQVGRPEMLHPLYTLHGHVLGAEAVIDTLPGYAGSRPVRVGNAAYGQVQLDVFGPIAELIAVLVERTGRVTDRQWHVLEAMVQAVASRWHEPDAGIWEIRDTPKHHVYSKVMCWATADRALQVAAVRGESRPDWEALRATIAADVLEHGWNEDLRAYASAYDRAELESSSLFVGLSGLLEPTDPRFVATVRAVEEHLRSGPVVFRYRHDDGLPGHEGGMHLCTAWLIQAYLITGQRNAALQLYRSMTSLAGPTLLLPEQFDPDAGRSLGNHPQAYSHLGLIRCARLLAASESV